VIHSRLATWGPPPGFWAPPSDSNPDTLRRDGVIDMGNARLRQLAAETVEARWWKLV
jgi:hypothetical protein